MFRRGKQEGWLSVSVDKVKPWAAQNNVELHHVSIGVCSEDKRGAGVFAEVGVVANNNGFTTLMTVPRRLALSRESVESHAKVDKDLQAVLEALGEFGRSSRISILTFLLCQATILDPSRTEQHFVPSPLTTYSSLLPHQLLPTSWSEETCSLLRGTTLLPALKAKCASLDRELSAFRLLTAQLEWCNRIWWNETTPLLSLVDWLTVDAMYRSRALEIPGIGDCMAPCIDMANHASGAATSGIYEVDADTGNVVLLLRPGKALTAGEEVTISYGDNKGACEMLFSYGFLEYDTQNAHLDTDANSETGSSPASDSTARELFLDLSRAPDDPMFEANMSIAGCPPGVKIVDAGDGTVGWEGDYVWLLCLVEDELLFTTEQSADGPRVYRASWSSDSTEITSARQLREKLELAPLWPVYRLRALSIIQTRIYGQVQRLYDSEEEVTAAAETQLEGSSEERQVEMQARSWAVALRKLERELLETAHVCLGDQIRDLAMDEVVVAYLREMNDGPGVAEDNEKVEESG